MLPITIKLKTYFFKFITITFLSLLSIGCASQQPKMNGISFVGAPKEISQHHISPLVDTHANWAAVMPFGFLRSISTPQVIYNVDRQWWGEREVGVKKTIALLNAKKIKIMLKPQIWIWGGVFTGTIQMNSESDWKVFENSYEDFILFYAQLAEDLKVPLFCIGTELHTFAQSRSKFWQQLILKVKNIYHGKLTYAENWDQYMNFPLWDKLDYIGIDAYFPVSDQQTPTLEILKKGWIPHKTKMVDHHQKYNKPILFTEFGYRSVDFTARTPWDANSIAGQYNMKGQNNAIKALAETFWHETWFAGGFLWKWFYNHDEVGGINDNRFTIQNKTSQSLIKELYTQ